MSTEQVALIPRCAECLDVWLPDDEDRWHCYVVDDGPDDNWSSTAVSARSESSTTKHASRSTHAPPRGPSCCDNR